MCYDVRGAKQRWDFLRFLLFTVSGLCMDSGQNMILEIREVEMNAADTKKRLITAGLILLMAAESVTMVSAASADQSAGADQTAHTAETQAPASETEDSSADKIVGADKTYKADRAEMADPAPFVLQAKPADKAEPADKADKSEPADKSDPADKAEKADPADKADAAAAAGTEKSAAESSTEKAPGTDERDVTLKAEDAYRNFLNGSKKVTYSSNHVAVNVLPLDNRFKDGKQYTFGEFQQVLQSVEDDMNKAFTDGKKTGDTVRAEYAFLEDGPSPLMALHFKSEEVKVYEGVDMYFILQYDEQSDEISVAYGRDAWSRGYLRINAAGIVTEYGSASAFEYFFDYYHVAGGGKVNHLYSAYYDNREAVLANLNTWEQETYLVSYTIPGYRNSPVQVFEKENAAAVVPDYRTEIYTLHGFSGGDSTFVVEPESMFDEEAPAYVVYKKTGVSISDNSTVIKAVMKGLSSANVSMDMFYAGKPAWNLCE